MSVKGIEDEKKLAHAAAQPANLIANDRVKFSLGRVAE